jgi:hypothetical protein
MAVSDNILLGFTFAFIKDRWLFVLGRTGALVLKQKIARQVVLSQIFL